MHSDVIMKRDVLTEFIYSCTGENLHEMCIFVVISRSIIGKHYEVFQRV